MKIQCGYCKGSGVRPVGKEYASTLQQLKRHPGVNGSELAVWLGCTPEAAANRLAYLERLGLATGERRGREIIWKAK